MENRPHTTTPRLRLNELLKAQPADATLQNLLSVVGSKLELCSRLPIFEYEAASEGNEASATAFRALAASERDSFDEAVAYLRAHLDAKAGADPAREVQELHR